MKAITDDTIVGYDKDGNEIKAERLSKWAYNQLETAPAMYEVLNRVLFITHNNGIGLSAITGKEDGTNRVVFTPEQLNEIGDTIRTVLAKAEGK
jgi:hypothetical protein